MWLCQPWPGPHHMPLTCTLTPTGSLGSRLPNHAPSFAPLLPSLQQEDSIPHAPLFPESEPQLQSPDELPLSKLPAQQNVRAKLEARSLTQIKPA